MTEVILFLQSGDDGPVRLVGVTERGMKRTLIALQRGNPELLRVRLAIRGDERTERRLHAAIDSHYRARDWYDPAAIGAVPATFLRHAYDERAERQRISRIELAEIVRRP
jgi:hypothetical protein